MTDFTNQLAAILGSYQPPQQQFHDFSIWGSGAAGPGIPDSGRVQIDRQGIWAKQMLPYAILSQAMNQQRPQQQMPAYNPQPYSPPSYIPQPMGANQGMRQSMSGNASFSGGNQISPQLNMQAQNYLQQLFGRR